MPMSGVHLLLQPTRWSARLSATSWLAGGHAFLFYLATWSSRSLARFEVEKSLRAGLVFRFARICARRTVVVVGER